MRISGERGVCLSFLNSNHDSGAPTLAHGSTEAKALPLADVTNEESILTPESRFERTYERIPISSTIFERVIIHEFYRLKDRATNAYTTLDKRSDAF